MSRREQAIWGLIVIVTFMSALGRPRFDGFCAVAVAVGFSFLFRYFTTEEFDDEDRT